MKRLITLIILAYISLFCLGCATLKESRGDTLDDIYKWINDFRHTYREFGKKTFIIKDIRE